MITHEDIHPFPVECPRYASRRRPALTYICIGRTPPGRHAGAGRGTNCCTLRLSRDQLVTHRGSEMRARVRRWIASGVGTICCAAVAAPHAITELTREQSAAAARIAPESMTIRLRGDKLHVRGGDLGRFDPQASFAENLRALLQRLGPLSNAHHAQFALTEQTPGKLRFVQVINGVPVIARNEVGLASAGRVLEVWLSVVDPARAPKDPPIALDRAMRIASLACANQHGLIDAEVELAEQPGLHYAPTPQGDALKFQYRFAAGVPGRAADFVTVNAITGAAEVSSALLP